MRWDGLSGVQIVWRCRLTSVRGWLRILARETKMRAKMMVSITLGSVALMISSDDNETSRALTVEEARRLASLLEDVATAIESAQTVGDSDD